MKLGSGEQLIRFTALTPANLGSAFGEATLDRPTQKDACWGLPFLPDSALKGVFASAYGDPDDSGNAKREAIFGSADFAGSGVRTARFGEPGPVVFGNGELVCFPIPAVDGCSAWVFPALHLAWALRLETEGKTDEALLRLLSLLEETDIPRVFAWPRLPQLDAAVRLEPPLGLSARLAAPALVSLLRRYAGPGLPPGAVLLVVSGAKAGELWRFAAERRALVALDPATRTTAGGALRFVELIPPGTVFLSFVSVLVPEGSPESYDLPERIQAGAWEGLGFGWLRPTPVEPPVSAAEEPQAEPVGGPTPMAIPQVMVDAHQAVERLRRSDPAFQRLVRSAVRHFGGRAQFSGVEAALAFELAKAKPRQEEPSLEARSHRWLLAALLPSDPKPPAPRGASQELLDWIASDPFAPGLLPAQHHLLLTRWLWLARYSEHLLEEGE
jgi:CRISPR/Cas system CMR subunit Cmr4 (Cas7 group RAMP superfamily)